MTKEEIKTLFFELCDAQRFDYEVEYVAALLDRLEVRYPDLMDEYRAREGLPNDSVQPKDILGEICLPIEL